MSNATNDRGVLPVVLKWCRRGTSIAIYVIVIACVVSERLSFSTIWDTSESAAAQLTLPLAPWKVLGVIGVSWYLFLAQLRVRWLVILPLYLVSYPIYALAAMVLARGWNWAHKLYRSHAAEPSILTPSSLVSAPKNRRLPYRKLWVVCLVLWLFFFNTETAPWARWVPAFLVVPLWVWSLRIAYSNTIRPATYAQQLFDLSAAVLEKCESEVEEAKTHSKDDAPLARLGCSFANYVLRRYAADRATTVLQRETLLTFSFFLVFAFGMSCLLWGLVAHAVIGNNSAFFGSYNFFYSRSFVECLIWTFGVMTTTVEYPGASAPVHIKLIHTFILFMGLFHLTYLLLGFSVMASAETQRTANRTAQRYQELLSRRDHVVIQLSNLRENSKAVDIASSPQTEYRYPSDNEPPAR